MSRLIVKNLPKHLSQEELAAHFASNGATVTDAKIMFKNQRSRLFGFVGFKTDADAAAALKYFNGTFLHTSKLDIAVAKAQGDDTLARPWSRHSQGSSANVRMLKSKGKLDSAQQRAAAKGATGASKEEVERKKSKFREFLKVMGVNKEEVGGSTTWNDSFQSYMDGNEKLRGPPKRQKKVEQEENKEEDKEDVKGDEEQGKVEVVTEKAEQKRLYVMNLSYEVTYDELMELFSKYGEVERIEIPLRKGGRGQALGIAYVTFKETEGAISCFATLDKTYF